MLGAVAGDMIGSVFERKASWLAVRTPHFLPLFDPQARFTDDTVLTVAVAEYFLSGEDLVDLLKRYARAYPTAGYGGTFARWSHATDRTPYGSWGNGSAMRVTPVGYACSTLDEVLRRAQETAQVTHNHPEGIKGAQSVAAAVFLARHGESKDAIRDYLEQQFQYDLGFTLDDLRPTYGFDVSCQGSVPPALRAFLEATDFESAIRLAVSLGGDTDTLACMAGGIAEAYYGGIPAAIRSQVLSRLDGPLRQVVEQFEARFMRGTTA